MQCHTCRTQMAPIAAYLPTELPQAHRAFQHIESGIMRAYCSAQCVEADTTAQIQAMIGDRRSSRSRSDSGSPKRASRSSKRASRSRSRSRSRSTSPRATYTSCGTGQCGPSVVAVGFSSGPTSTLLLGKSRHSSKSKHEHPSPTKAREMLHHGEVHGHALTDKQRRYFGLLAGGGHPRSEN